MRFVWTERKNRFIAEISPFRGRQQPAPGPSAVLPELDEYHENEKKKFIIIAIERPDQPIFGKRCTPAPSREKNNFFWFGMHLRPIFNQ